MEQNEFYNKKYSGDEVYTETSKVWIKIRDKFRSKSPVTEYKERFILSMLDNIENKRILEIGPGKGTFATWFCADKSLEYHAIDISIASVKMLNKEFKKRNYYNALATCEDGSKTNFKTDYFDVILGFGVLHHFDSIKNALIEIMRILSPNGKAIFYEPLNINPIIKLFRKLTIT